MKREKPHLKGIRTDNNTKLQKKQQKKNMLYEIYFQKHVPL